MAFIDYYKILGVSKDIPQKDVKKAYLKRAKQFHPDLHPNDPKAKAKFQALNEAYTVINDPEKRKKYDMFGEKWNQVDEQASQGGGAWGNFGGDTDFMHFGGNMVGGFSSFFENLFGKGGGWTNMAGTQQQPAEATLEVDMYTALLGGEVTVNISGESTIRLKIKPETQNGSKIRLKGKGPVARNGKPSDLILTIHVKLPQHLSERQRQLLMEMRNA